MTDRELKKLSRFEILELLLESEKQNAALKNQIQEEEKTIADLTEQLNKKEIDIQEAGSIADAVLKISGIFQTAQDAAEDYLENVRNLSGKQEEICAEIEERSKAEAERITSEADSYSQELLANTEKECSLKQEETEKYCRMLRETTERECQNQRDETAKECQTLRSMTDQYCENLKSTTENRCRSMETEVTTRCSDLEKETAERCEQKKSDARKEMDSYWKELSGRLEEFYESHQGMKEALSSFNLKMPDFTGGKDAAEG